jgi:hypothetical protein
MHIMPSIHQMVQMDKRRIIFTRMRRLIDKDNEIKELREALKQG